MKTFFVLDVGGTNCRLAHVDEAGVILTRETHPTPSPTEFYPILSQFFQKLTPQPIAAGIAIAGPVDPETGTLYSPANLKGWGEEPLGEKAANLLKIPVFCGNDASLAAFGEKEFGAGKDYDDLLLITLGTGIGGGAICSGQLLLGAKGQGMEVGHMAIYPEGLLCGCGGRGHLEAYVSGTALGIIATERFSREMKAQELFELTDRGSEDEKKQALTIISQASDDLGLGLANVVHLFSPQMILFSGSLSSQWDSLVGPALEKMEANLMASFKGQVKAKLASLKDDAGLIGAMAWARFQLGQI